MIRSTSLRDTAVRYYYLTKPGIIYGNCLSAAAGFLLAASGTIDWRLFAALLIGMAFVIASGCVFNNHLDRSIDKKMERTRQRALVTGAISSRAAILYATLLGIAGFAILVAYTNTLTIAAGIVGILSYVVVYGVAKRRTAWGTVIGSIPGAMPITAGYLAVSGRLDGGAILLFLAMVCWQMPHFYAIAMYRLNDYRAAGLPVLPAKHGFHRTKIEILAYIAAYAIVCICLSLTGYTGWLFAIGMLATSGVWFWNGLTGIRSVNEVAWAKRMFRKSLLVLLVFSSLLATNWLLP